MSFKTQVESGARLLDNKNADWLDKIDFTVLDLASGKECVLGQVFGSYDSGLVKVGIYSSAAAQSYGFNASWDYDGLAKAWKDAFLPEEGKVYESTQYAPRHKYLRIEKVVGLGNSTRLFALPVYKESDGTFKVSGDGREYLTRRVSFFRYDWKKFADAPKPGAFLQSAQGTKFFVTPDSRLWNMSKPSVAWISYNNAVTEYGTLTPVKTVGGDVFTASHSI